MSFAAAVLVLGFFVNLTLHCLEKDAVAHEDVDARANVCKTVRERSATPKAEKPSEAKTEEPAKAPASKPTRATAATVVDVDGNSNTSRDQLRGALMGMGWKAAQVDKCLGSLGARVMREPAPALLREAIGILSHN